jgi:hypothetical protein
MNACWPQLLLPRLDATLVNRMQSIQRQLADTRASDATRSALQSELSQASKLLDYSKKYVPMH